MKKQFSFVIAASLAASLSSFGALSMEFVTIGDEGNSPDGGGGPGSVAYKYDIGKFEVSADQFNDAVGAGTTGTSGTTAATGISYVEAARFCNFLTSGNINTGAYTIVAGVVTATLSRNDIISSGERYYVLPTKDEWYKAAYYTGSGYSLYSDGTSNPGSPPVSGVGGFNYANAIGSPWAIGSGTNEHYGTTDMNGNVWEWVDEEPSVNTRVVFGGSYASSENGLRNTGSINLGIFTEGGEVGFRVVAVPEPGTISLMSLSTLGLFLTRSVRRRKLAGKSLFPVRREYVCDSYSMDKDFDSYESVDSNEYLLGIAKACKEHLMTIFGLIHGYYKIVDNRFWDYMIVSRERHTQRKQAIKKSVRQKIADSYDAFLAMIMK